MLTDIYEKVVEGLIDAAIKQGYERGKRDGGK